MFLCFADTPSFYFCQDVSTTMIVQPGPVVDFLIANQNVRDPYSIDWAKVSKISECFPFVLLWSFNRGTACLINSVQAKRTLKNLRIKTSPANQEYKITGLSDLPCKEQTSFFLFYFIFLHCCFRVVFCMSCVISESCIMQVFSEKQKWKGWQ